MKRSFLCLLVALFVTPCGVAVAAGSTEITASGSGSVALQPDVATVSAAVETNAAAADDAVSQNNAIYDRVVSAVTKMGISRGDIALSYYNISYNPPPKTISANSDERYGYTVSRSFSVKVREIGKAGAVSDACIGAGATRIDGVSFGLSDTTSARSQAIAKAAADARRNADALARAEGLRIVAIKSLEVNNEFAGPQPLGAMARMSAPTQLDQSNVSVSVSITAVFLAEP